jgi:S-adenosyl-L-methionine hydrolase (adenosine-forming)
VTGSVARVPGRYQTISFLTDYGTRDEFVGVVKVVVRDLAPHVVVVDLTHEIPPFDVRAGALALARCVSYVPEGVVLAVVDPGVATERRAVAVEVGDGAGVFVGPDNGLLAPAVALAGGATRAVELTNTDFHLPAPGATFAGRDVFAPAAAHLCNGVDLLELCAEVDPHLLVPATIPLPRDDDGAVVAEVLWVDRFGNCQLNVGPADLPAWGDTVRLRLGSPSDPGGVRTRAAHVTASFAAAGGGIALVLDSYGMLAVCLDRRSAADELDLDVGDMVVLSAADDEQSPPAVAVTLGPSR